MLNLLLNILHTFVNLTNASKALKQISKSNYFWYTIMTMGSVQICDFCVKLCVHNEITHLVYITVLQ
jgi:hypothetical protein